MVGLTACLKREKHPKPDRPGNANCMRSEKQVPTIPKGKCTVRRRIQSIPTKWWPMNTFSIHLLFQNYITWPPVTVTAVGVTPVECNGHSLWTRCRICHLRRRRMCVEMKNIINLCVRMNMSNIAYLHVARAIDLVAPTFYLFSFRLISICLWLNMCIFSQFAILLLLLIAIKSIRHFAWCTLV